MITALIALLTVMAATIGTIAGFGTSTIVVPVLVLFFPLPISLLLAGIIHWFNDGWKIILFYKGIKWRLILLFGVPGLILSLVGAELVFLVSQTLLQQILGGILTIYAIFLFFNPRFKLKSTILTATFGGAVSGFLAGIFGIGGAVRSAFLSAFNLKKVVFIATSGAIGLIVDSTRLITYFSAGTRLPSDLVCGLLVFIPASFLGAYIGKKITDKIPQNQFRLVIAVFLLLIGIKLLFPLS